MGDSWSGGARLLGLISSGSVGRGMSLGEGDDEGEREGSGTEDRDKYCFRHFTLGERFSLGSSRCHPRSFVSCTVAPSVTASVSSPCVNLP